MSLKDFTPQTETIPLPHDNSFVVRGLSLDDITSLVSRHYEPLSTLFDQYISDGVANAVAEVQDDSGLTEIIMKVAKQAPKLIIDVICHAADERDAQAQTALVPTGTQIIAIEAIIRLTLQAEGGLEKLAATVTRLGSNLKGITEVQAA